MWPRGITQARLLRTIVLCILVMQYDLYVHCNYQLIGTTTEYSVCLEHFSPIGFKPASALIFFNFWRLSCRYHHCTPPRLSKSTFSKEPDQC
jgi:hypothetical protein